MRTLEMLDRERRLVVLQDRSPIAVIRQEGRLVYKSSTIPAQNALRCIHKQRTSILNTKSQMKRLEHV